MGAKTLISAFSEPKEESLIKFKTNRTMQPRKQYYVDAIHVKSEEFEKVKGRLAWRLVEGGRLMGCCGECG